MRRLCSLCLGSGALLAAAAPAAAHPAGPVAPGELWSSWTPEPWVLLGAGVAALLYARGAGRLWRRAGVGRGIRRWQLGCYAAGLITAVLALASPLDTLGGSLFSAHMAQHELLILVAAPLLVLGTPLLPLLWAMPLRWRRRVGRVAKVRGVRAAWSAVSHPATAWALHALALWLWHAPPLYQASLRSEAVHVLQHASFFGTALLFWWSLLRAGRRRGYGLGVLCVFTTAAHGSLLGALLTFGTRPWYPLYAGTAPAWGLTALEDQQLGGLIMWIPGGVVYLLAAVALFAAWLRAVERRVERREGRAPGVRVAIQTGKGG